ncbi:uncharacterized protein N7479_001630 [Penicillium vulpinum]|uniref:Uncharacterized protein n=1 Tax=Penicillium vulpinum TaxID=29845 RepID=A0A1V6QY93_9EURO|nr:uncharacterized protein N7479_001630 [Penicillium vulpinum]KAJ5971712.1 hypothetical protein N7479_001630 [Penicillium vulpinum]OQD94159.1 hypothetical protein PENVUL_c151G07804 [Penicillium vulpinum]
MDPIKRQPSRPEPLWRDGTPDWAALERTSRPSAPSSRPQPGPPVFQNPWLTYEAIVVIADEPVAEPATEEPATEDPVADEPATKPATEEPVEEWIIPDASSVEGWPNAHLHPHGVPATENLSSASEAFIEAQPIQNSYIKISVADLALYADWGKFRGQMRAKKKRRACEKGSSNSKLGWRR